MLNHLDKTMFSLFVLNNCVFKMVISKSKIYIVLFNYKLKKGMFTHQNPIKSIRIIYIPNHNNRKKKV